MLSPAEHMAERTGTSHLQKASLAHKAAMFTQCNFQAVQPMLAWSALCLRLLACILTWTGEFGLYVPAWPRRTRG